jgi:hypothetical protein
MKNAEIKSSIDLRWLGAELVKRGNAYLWVFNPTENDVIVKLPPLEKAKPEAERVV